MLFSIISGFGLGVAVSIFNHWLAVKALKGNDAKASKKKFTNRIFFRYFLNFVVLFLVYKNVPMLIATALGLTMVKNYILIQYTLGKKGVS